MPPLHPMVRTMVALASAHLLQFFACEGEREGSIGLQTLRERARSAQGLTVDNCGSSGCSQWMSFLRECCFYFRNNRRNKLFLLVSSVGYYWVPELVGGN